MTDSNLTSDKRLMAAAREIGATVRAITGWNELRITFPGQPVETVDRGHTISDKVESRREALAIARRMAGAPVPDRDCLEGNNAFDSSGGTLQICPIGHPAERAAAQGLAPKCLDLAPRWAGLIPAFMAIAESGDSEGRAMVEKELTRLAEFADSHLAAQETKERGVA